MNLAIIQRLVISGCRGKIDRRVASSILYGRTVIKAGFPAHYMIHGKSFHDFTTRSEKLNSKENECDIADNASAFQMKTRSSRRNRTIISDTILKSNVSLSYEELERFLTRACNEKKHMFEGNFCFRRGL